MELKELIKNNKELIMAFTLIRHGNLPEEMRKRLLLNLEKEKRYLKKSYNGRMVTGDFDKYILILIDDDRRVKNYLYERIKNNKVPLGCEIGVIDTIIDKLNLREKNKNGL